MRAGKLSRWFFVVAALLITSFSLAQQVIAEGVYGAPSTNGEQNGAFRWTMLESANGDLTIRVRPAAARLGTVSGSVEYRISKDWEWRAFALRAVQPDAVKTTMSFTCEQHRSLECVAKIPGDVDWKGAIEAVPPYIILCCEEASGDIVWNTAIALKHAQHLVGSVTEVSVIGMHDENDRSEQTKLAVLETDEFTFVGTRQLAFALGVIQADVFSSKDMTLWLAPSGIILAMSESPEKPPSVELLTLDKGRERLLPSLKPPAPH